jgi:hypothetical protein
MTMNIPDMLMPMKTYNKPQIIGSTKIAMVRIEHAMVALKIAMVRICPLRITNTGQIRQPRIKPTNRDEPIRPMDRDENPSRSACKGSSVPISPVPTIMKNALNSNAIMLIKVSRMAYP